jgi:hypothetical protein
MLPLNSKGLFSSCESMFPSSCILILQNHFLWHPMVIMNPRHLDNTPFKSCSIKVTHQVHMSIFKWEIIHKVYFIKNQLESKLPYKVYNMISTWKCKNEKLNLMFHVELFNYLKGERLNHAFFLFSCKENS